MLNIAKMLKPWKEAGSLNAQLNLYGFWSDTVRSPRAATS